MRRDLNAKTNKSLAHKSLAAV